MQKSVKWQTIIKFVIPVVILFLSFCWFGSMATDVDRYGSVIESLDNKKDSVMALTAASTATSAAITLIPGDVGTPIAEKLADLSGYFVFILCVVYLEKYLLTIAGFVAFRILIPIACILFLIAQFLVGRQTVQVEKNNENDDDNPIQSNLTRLSVKLAVFGLILWALVPCSVKVSSAIESIYQTSINQTVQKAEDTSDDVKKSASKSSEDENWFEKLVNKTKDGASNVIEKFQQTLNSMVEAVAVMIVTSCLIPLAVLFFFIWVVRMFFNLNAPYPSMKKHHFSGALRRVTGSKRIESTERTEE